MISLHENECKLHRFSSHFNHQVTVTSSRLLRICQAFWRRAVDVSDISFNVADSRGRRLNGEPACAGHNVRNEFVLSVHCHLSRIPLIVVRMAGKDGIGPDSCRLANAVHLFEHCGAAAMAKSPRRKSTRIRRMMHRQNQSFSDSLRAFLGDALQGCRQPIKLMHPEILIVTQDTHVFCRIGI